MDPGGQRLTPIQTKASENGLKPLIRLAHELKAYLPGPLANARGQLNTCVHAGINNKIQVFKRIAYGFRHHAYFCLKIRAGFHGIPR